MEIYGDLLGSTPFIKAHRSEDGSLNDVIYVPRSNSDALDIYNSWLLGFGICTAPALHGTAPGSPSPCPTETLDLSKEYLELIHAYSLGEQVQDASFQNAIMETLIEKICRRHEPHAHMTAHIYKTTTGPALRRLILDLYIWWLGPKWVSAEAAHNAELPEQFLLDLCAKLFVTQDPQVGTMKPPFVGAGCRYHVAGPKKLCQGHQDEKDAIPTIEGHVQTNLMTNGACDGQTNAAAKE